MFKVVEIALFLKHPLLDILSTVIPSLASATAILYVLLINHLEQTFNKWRGLVASASTECFNSARVNNSAHVVITLSRSVNIATKS